MIFLLSDYTDSNDDLENINCKDTLNSSNIDGIVNIFYKTIKILFYCKGFLKSREENKDSLLTWCVNSYVCNVLLITNENYITI